VFSRGSVGLNDCAFEIYRDGDLFTAAVCLRRWFAYGGLSTMVITLLG